jgi:hypothetical protein
MGQLQLLVQASEVRGDTTRRIQSVWRKPTYTDYFESEFPITTSKVQVATHLATIDLVFIKVLTDDITVDVYKDSGSEYWTVSDLMIAMDAGITTLSIQGSAAGEAYIYLGGSVT